MSLEMPALDTALKLVNSYGLPLVLLFLMGRWLRPLEMVWERREVHFPQYEAS